MGEVESSLLYMQKSLIAQRNALGLNSKAEAALLNYALTQANTGYLKCKAGHLDAIALLEDSLLVRYILVSNSFGKRLVQEECMELTENFSFCTFNFRRFWNQYSGTTI